MAGPNHAISTRQVELILGEVDALPTLPAIATRVLALTSNDDAETREVVELIKSDQSLTAKVLAICRHADMGIREEVLTIDRAVVMLGFNAIRNAVLSVKVMEVFDAGESGQRPERGHGLAAAEFPRSDFWRHSLAVGLAAQDIAAGHRGPVGLAPDEAFVCGLLHDLGKLALDQLLPQAYQRVVELADLNQANIAEFERRVIGLDHQTAGKRLAEQWRLPDRIRDCIWLHGSAVEALPKLPHRRLIGLISLADAVARRCHLGFSGNFDPGPDVREVALALEFKPEVIEQTVSRLHEQFHERAKALGLDTPPSRDLFLASLQQANAALGRMNAALERRSRRAAREATLLEAIEQFSIATARAPGVMETFDAIAASAAVALGNGPVTLVCPQPTEDETARPTWLTGWYADGERLRRKAVDPGAAASDIGALTPQQLASAVNDPAVAEMTAIVIPTPGDDQAPALAVLLHPTGYAGPARELDPLRAAWGAAICAAQRQENLSRLGEALAQANRNVQEMERQIARMQTLARVGEIAAGAAHEMNNPLAIISGRSQLLGTALQPGSDEAKAIHTIQEQAHRLSDLITSLRLFAAPPGASRGTTDLHALLDDVVRKFKNSPAAGGVKPEQRDVTLHFRNDLPSANVDAQMISGALHELILNAVQAGATNIAVSARTTFESGESSQADNALVVQVKDNGPGMDAYTLEHAMDPFFSSKSAGRRVGMGLPRAQQYAAAHGGKIDLRSAPGNGTVATLTIPLTIPLDSRPASADTTAATGARA